MFRPLPSLPCQADLGVIRLTVRSTSRDLAISVFHSRGVFVIKVPGKTEIGNAWFRSAAYSPTRHLVISAATDSDRSVGVRNLETQRDSYRPQPRNNSKLSGHQLWNP
jgi:hypothetical protein